MARVRIATRASCRAPRRRAWAWTSSVATTGSAAAASASRSSARSRPGRRADGALQLDVDVRPKASRAARRAASASAGRRAPARGTRPCARAAGEADQPLGALEHRLEGAAGSASAGPPLRRARGGVGQRDQPAEVGVAASRVLGQQREVAARRRVRQRQLAAGDRPHPRRPRRVGERQRAAEPVVVGERQRPVAQRGGAVGQLLGLRGAVQEAERRVAVQLDVVGVAHVIPAARTSARARAGPRRPPSRGRRPAPAPGSGGGRAAPSTSPPPRATPRAPPRPRGRPRAAAGRRRRARPGWVAGRVPEGGDGATLGWWGTGRQRGTRPKRRSGSRLAPSTSTMRSALPSPTAARTCRAAASSRAARTTPSAEQRLLAVARREVAELHRRAGLDRAPAAGAACGQRQQQPVAIGRSARAAGSSRSHEPPPTSRAISRTVRGSRPRALRPGQQPLQMHPQRVVERLLGGGRLGQRERLHAARAPARGPSRRGSSPARQPPGALALGAEAVAHVRAASSTLHAAEPRDAERLQRPHQAGSMPASGHERGHRQRRQRFAHTLAPQHQGPARAGATGRGQARETAPARRRGEAAHPPARCRPRAQHAVEAAVQPLDGPGREQRRSPAPPARPPRRSPRAAATSSSAAAPPRPGSGGKSASPGHSASASVSRIPVRAPRRLGRRRRLADQRLAPRLRRQRRRHRLVDPTLPRGGHREGEAGDEEGSEHGPGG